MTDTAPVHPRVLPAFALTAPFALALSFALALLVGCSQLEPVPPTQPVTDATQLYLRLTLNYPVINLSTDTTQSAYYTAQLAATPYDGTGAPMVGAPAPTFTSLDTSAVTVTPDGLLRAHRATSEARVVATLAIGEVRHSDTARVSIRDLAPPPVLATLSIQVPPESAVWYVPALSGQGITQTFANFVHLIPSRTLSSRVIDDAGNPMAGLAIDYVSLDSAVALVNRRNGQVTPIAAGHVRVVARTLAYGVAKADTMTYTVQGPFTADVTIDSLGFFAGSHPNVRPPTLTVIIAAGGLVSWGSITAQPMDVTFDDPTNVAQPPAAFCNIVAAFTGVPGPYCGTGNIATMYQDPTTGVGPDGAPPLRTRRFPVPGTYPFHSTTTGAEGRIVVLEPVPLP